MMCKKILQIGFLLFISTNLYFGQISITLQGQNNDISGQSHVMNITSGSEQIIDFSVYNNTGSTKQWKIKRKRLDVPSTWTDNLCWGIQCYGTDQMPTNPWSTPSAKTVADGESALLSVHIDPSDVANGSGHYRYYVGESQSISDDSVDIQIGTTLSIKENKVVSSIISTYPNPADNFLTVSLQSNQEGYLKMTDVLGKIVLEEKISGTKKIDVEGFKNGVYILALSSNGSSITKRIVIKH